MLLVEAMISLSILTVIGLIMLKLSLNIVGPRQWIVQQTMSDAYMTYERAYAERIPFEDLLAAGSPWPAFPQTSRVQVEIGRLPRTTQYPDGIPVMGTVTRTRIADPQNFPIDGGTGDTTTNPAAMKIWRAQSVLTYRIGDKPYAKSRSVIRSQ